MNELQNVASQFDKTLASFLLKIQTKKSFDLDEINQLDFMMNTIAALAKNEPMLPKAMLNVFRTGSKILLAELPYLKQGADKISHLSHQMDYVLDLILSGECPTDRKPGVPRII